jgi:hypothetical protein
MSRRKRAIKLHWTTLWRSILLLCAVVLLAACGGSARDASTAAAAPAAAAVSATLQCQDCVDAGITQANIFASPEMDSLACRELWGTKVQIVETQSKNEVPIYRVKTPSCTGWVSSRLVQR